MLLAVGLGIRMFFNIYIYIYICICTFLECHLNAKILNIS